MIRATEGRILIDGRDIRDNTSEIQSSFGLCPQHNLLFTDLTVMEHLIFFGVVCVLLFNSKIQPILIFLLFIFSYEECHLKQHNKKAENF